MATAAHDLFLNQNAGHPLTRESVLEIESLLLRFY